MTDVERQPVDKRYLKFVELFNSREFYEAHDVLEELWLEWRGEERKYYQGLIQAAVALLHYMRGNYTGARSLERAASDKLMRYPEVYLGAQVHRLVDDLHRFFDDHARTEGHEVPYGQDMSLPRFQVNLGSLEASMEAN